jgi:TPR repeat protein
VIHSTKPAVLERAIKGDTEAQHDLAQSYEGGPTGLPQDFGQAAHWRLAAANPGDLFAEASLGTFCNVGKGVRQSRSFGNQSLLR